jgi:phosphoribosylformimino-5-aminoimidazole carboxamide ribonucleotide (ProFAR) isomerase
MGVHEVARGLRLWGSIGIGSTLLIPRRILAFSAISYGKRIFLSVDKRGKGEQTTKKWNAQSFHSFILSVSKTPSNEMNRRTVTSISLVAVFDPSSPR